MVSNTSMSLRELLKYNKKYKRYILKDLEQYNVIVEPNVDNHIFRNKNNINESIWKNIADTIDDAKFILTVRNPLDMALSKYKNRILKATDYSTTLGAKYDEEVFMQYSIVIYQNIIQDLERIKYIQTEYVFQIMEYFSDMSERLLIMNVCNGDGYEKLLPFLGLEVPENIPVFPHKNKH